MKKVPIKAFHKITLHKNDENQGFFRVLKSQGPKEKTVDGKGLMNGVMAGMETLK